MKKLFDKPWKIWTGVGTVVTTAATVGYMQAPVKYKILIDNIITVVKPLINGVAQ